MKKQLRENLTNLIIGNMHDLRDLNSFGVKASAEKLVKIKSVNDISSWLKLNFNAKILILGGGSNLLILEDLNYAVLKNEIMGKRIIEDEEDYVLVEMGAGESWPDFVGWAVENDFGGIENLALIPGSVGAAPIQNIGAYGVEVQDVITRVEFCHLAQDKLLILQKDQCQFAYRSSIFKNELKGKAFITKVIFRLSKAKHKLNTNYGAIRKLLNDRQLVEPGIGDIYAAVISIRKSKLPDPATLGNAGSFFKNPIVDKSVLKDLKKDYPLIPYYVVDKNHVKLAAAWLIDEAGWKGRRKGNVGCYEKQALILVNFGGASGKEILAFALEIVDSIFEKFGIRLQPEINIIG